jgi:hypothetical protein
MKRTLLLLTLSLILFLSSIAQVKDRFLYEAKIENLMAKLEVKFWSEDIIEYAIIVQDKSGKSIFKQDGYALNQDLAEYVKHGMDYGEQIGEPYNPIRARPYLVKCKCDKWLDIKVAKDKSIIQVDCGQELLNQLKGDYSDTNRNSQLLGIFNVKKLNN